MTAPILSPAESARLAAFDVAPDAPESYAATVERMARAMADTMNHVDPDWYFETYADLYRKYAAAAFRVVPVDGGAA